MVLRPDTVSPRDLQDPALQPGTQHEDPMAALWILQHPNAMVFLDEPGVPEVGRLSAGRILIDDRDVVFLPPKTVAEIPFTAFVADAGAGDPQEADQAFVRFAFHQHHAGRRLLAAHSASSELRKRSRSKKRNSSQNPASGCSILCLWTTCLGGEDRWGFRS
jgi:hypothetical protein